MSRHVQNSRPFYSSSLSQIQDWAEVSGRGVLSLIGLTLLGLMTWGLGVAVIKVAVVTFASLVGPTMWGLGSLGGAQALWAVVEGVAIGLLVLMLRRGWLAFKRRKLPYDAPQTVTPQAAPALVAGIAVGLTALAVGLGVLPTAMEAGGKLDLATGIPALLDSTNMISVGGGTGGGGGGDGPKIDIYGGYGAIVALLALLMIAGIVVGAVVGGGLGGVGLGALSGAAEGAAGSADETARAGALASALSGAASGALAGALSTAISIHLAYVFADTDQWGPLFGFDIVAAVFTVLLLRLCRRTWDNPRGLLGNTFEAAKLVLVLFQYALGLVLAVLLLGSVIWVLKWIFN